MRSQINPGILIGFAMILAACGGQPAPASPTGAPAPATKAAPPAAQPGAPAAAPVDAQADAEWQKIVEAGKAEGRVTIYGRLLGGPEGTMIAEEFHKATGIVVDFVAGAGSPMFQRIREESKAGRPTADIYEGAQPWPATIEREGFFVSLKGKPLPFLREPKSTWVVDPLFMSDGGFYLASRFSGGEGHLAVNTRIVPNNDLPKSFQEMASDPKYKGKIAWVDPKTTSDLGFQFTRHAYVGRTLTLRDLWLIYANQDPVLFPNPQDASAGVGRGEAGLSTSTTGLLSAANAGAPVKVISFPDAANVDTLYGMGIIKDTPHLNASLVFADWVMSKEGHDVITRINAVRGVRRDVPNHIPDALKSEVIGGGKKGPSYVMTAIQAQLAGEMEGAGVFKGLTERISWEEFERGYNNFLTQWEAKQGGPQNQQITAQD